MRPFDSSPCFALRLILRHWFPSPMQGFDELWLGDSILNFLSKQQDIMSTVTQDGASVFVAAVPGHRLLVSMQAAL